MMRAGFPASCASHGLVNCEKQKKNRLFTFKKKRLVGFIAFSNVPFKLRQPRAGKL